MIDNKENNRREDFTEDDIRTMRVEREEDDIRTMRIEPEDEIRTLRVSDEERDAVGEHLREKTPPAVKMRGRKTQCCYHCFADYDTDRFDVCPVCGAARRTEPERNCHLYPGTFLRNQILIGEVIAAGGFGVTYRAWDSNLNVMVAVKEYFNTYVVRRNPGEAKVQVQPGKNAQYREEIDRFLLEARGTAQFRTCRNIVYVYDIFEENGTAYMVMEFLDGITLSDAVKDAAKNGTRLDWKWVVNVGLNICDAAAQLHKRNMIHRDISPDNIFLCSDGKVKLIDMGAAKFPGVKDLEGQIVKQGYSPPEQYRDAEKQIGPWSDVYALAATLYAAITGCQVQKSTEREKEDQLELPSKIVPELPESVEKAILRGMSLDFRLRFQSMEEFATALKSQNVLGTEEVVKRRKRNRTALIASLILAALAAVVFLFQRYRSMQNRELLSEAAIEIWVPMYRDEIPATDKYREMSSEFMQLYEGVSVKFVEIPAEEYADRVVDGSFGGKAGCVMFLADLIAEGTSVECADLSEIFEDIQAQDFVFSLKGSGNTEIPLGFQMISAFGCQTADNENTTVAASSVDQFLQGEKGLYLGDSGDYRKIQEGMPGVYRVLSLSPDDVRYCYTDRWSVIKEADDTDLSAAIRLLSYWVGETAQDILHIQNQGALPVNKKELETYKSVNEELFPTELFLKGVPVGDDEYEKQKEQLANDPEKLAQLAKQMTE